MAVVTISRTMGSGGDYIGRELASVLGYKFVDKDKIAAIIKDFGIIRLDDISLEEAEALVRRDDRHRRKFIESYLYFEPHDVNLFDVVLDTSVVEPDVCVEVIRLICDSAAPDVRSDTLKSLDELEVDPVLQKHIAEKLT